jgi:hypothetical protein
MSFAKELAIEANSREFKSFGEKKLTLLKRFKYPKSESAPAVASQEV